MTTRISSTGALVLIALLTIGSFLLFESGWGSLPLGLAIFGIAIAKIVLIVSRYMHISWSHRPFAQAFAVWSVVVALILTAGLAALPWTHSSSATSRTAPLPSE